MTESTVIPSIEQNLQRLSRMAQEFSASLIDLQAKLVRRNLSLPSEMLDKVRRLQGSIGTLEITIAEHERQRRNLLGLAELGGVINSSLQLDVVLNEVIDTLIQLTGASRAFLMLTTEAGDMEIVVARNWERESLSEAEQEFSRTIVDQVVSSGEAILTNNAQTDTRFGKQESVVAYNLRSILCVPLIVRDSLTGVIYADNKVKEGLFSEDELNLLRAFSDQAAVALENARLFESVQQSLAEVTELKQLMENVFASIASGVITTDQHNIITLANQSAESILGMPEGGLQGRSLKSVLDPIDTSLMDHALTVMREKKRLLGVEIRRENGHDQQELSFQFTPLQTATGMIQGVAIVLEDLTEQRQLQAQRRLFERMVSPAVINELDPDSLHLGGQRAQITTLFADLRGYTSFSEKTPPEVLVSVLNRYLAKATAALLGEGATIDKFLGDAVMAWFNAPVLQPDHAARAVRSARRLSQAVSELHRELPPEWHLEFGIGIHSGDALLGLVGAQERLEYTAIGDSVNIAKRLQEHAKPGQVLISQAAVQQMKDAFQVRPIEPLQVAGISRPLTVYELINPDD